MVTLGSSYSAKLGCLGSYTFFALFLSFLLLLSEIPLPLRRMLVPHAISVNSLLITSVIRSRNRASKWCGDASLFPAACRFLLPCFPSPPCPTGNDPASRGRSADLSKASFFPQSPHTPMDVSDSVGSHLKVCRK